MSPGGTVELIEISTRKTTVERTIEQSTGTIQKSEKDTTTEDELSDAVRQENASDTKLGVSAASNTNYNTGFVNGSVTVTGSFNLDQQQKQAREQTHKTTRQQTQKLSSEIRQSYKSTLKTTTETTDTTSKRYVLQNNTDALVNYELRRKMRQVGIQLQDYGTRLCWQAYVDNPGDTLGVALFVHAAPLPDLQDIKAPEQPPAPVPLVRGDAIVVHAAWDRGDNSQYNFVPLGDPVSIVPPSGYVYDHAEIVLQQGPPWFYRVWPARATDTTIQIQQNPPITAGADFIGTVGSAADGTAEPSVKQVWFGVVTAPGGLRDDNKYDITVQITPIFSAVAGPSEKGSRHGRGQSNEVQRADQAGLPTGGVPGHPRPRQAGQQHPTASVLGAARGRADCGLSLPCGAAVEYRGRDQCRSARPARVFGNRGIHVRHG